MKKVTIHQPEFLPYYGFWHKVAQADILVILDNVPYRKNYFQNRNRIIAKNEEGWQWITVPVKGGSEPIQEKEIDSKLWNHARKKMIRTLRQVYGKYEGFKIHGPRLIEILETDTAYLIDFLVELNMALIEYLDKAIFGKELNIVFASDLKARGSKSELILNICKEVEATKYISGQSGKDYLDTFAFKRAGIEVMFDGFTHPIYHQKERKGQPFVPNLSIIDMLFRSIEIFQSNGQKRD